MEDLFELIDAVDAVAVDVDFFLRCVGGDRRVMDEVEGVCGVSEDLFVLRT